MKARVLILFIICFPFQAFAQTEFQTYWLENSIDVNIGLSNQSKKTFNLKFDRVKEILELTTDRNHQWIHLWRGIAYENPTKFLVADFNFDGFADVAVPTAVTIFTNYPNDSFYSIQNRFYDLYFYDPANDNFQFVPIFGSAGWCNYRFNEGTSGWANPQLEPENKTALSTCNGDLNNFYFKRFRFEKGKPYVYQDGESVFLTGFPKEKHVQNLLWKIQNLDHNKQVLGISWLDFQTKKIPIRYIPKARVFLSSAPRENAMTKSYIIKNDLISILEVRDTDSGQWLKISYQSQKLGRIVRWINLGI